MNREEVLAQLGSEIAKWMNPDDVEYVDELPHTATGKVHTLELRKQFADYRLPDDRQKHIPANTPGSGRRHFEAGRINTVE